MAVEDVWAPKSKTEIDPKKQGEKAEEGGQGAAYWEKKAAEARARREFVTEEITAAQLQERANAPAESPFKITGEFNLGKFDMQEQQRQLEDRIANIQKETQDKINNLQTDKDHYRDEVAKLQLEMVEKSFAAQIAMLQKTILEGTGNRNQPGFMDMITQTEQIAKILGYKKAEEGSGLAPEVRIALMKMDMENQTAMRKFEWDKIQSERMWQLEIKKIEQAAQSELYKAQLEKDKRGMIASPFESIGAAIARGLMDGGGNIGGTPKRTLKKSNLHIEALVGDAGEIDCPECHQVIAIGPTSTEAVCPGCETRFPINRSERVAEDVPANH